MYGDPNKIQEVTLSLPLKEKDEKTKEKSVMRKGLYANIHAKRKRGGKMRKKGAGVNRLPQMKSGTNSEEKIMTKLCPRGKAALNESLKFIRAYAMHMPKI